MRKSKSFIKSRSNMREVIDMVNAPEPIQAPAAPAPLRRAKKAKEEESLLGWFLIGACYMVTVPFLAAAL